MQDTPSDYLQPCEEGEGEATTRQVMMQGEEATEQDAATDLFLKGPMDSLQNFQYYFGDEKEINAFLAAALGPEAISYTGWEPTQSTRVRRAWRRPHHLREKHSGRGKGLCNTVDDS